MSGDLNDRILRRGGEGRFIRYTVEEPKRSRKNRGIKRVEFSSKCSCGHGMPDVQGDAR
jgi:hypothetical protein